MWSQITVVHLFSGGDVFHARIATHYCESTKIPHLEMALLAMQDTSKIEEVLNRFCTVPKSDFTLSSHLHQINNSFNASSVEEIFSNLETDGSKWANETLKASHFVKT